jgi:Tfp pilus assembly protein PilX
MNEAMYARRPRERGTVLVIALILLASLTLMATGAVQSAIMGLRIASNSEETTNAFQTAQAAIDYALSDISLLPMSGALNTPTNVAVTGTPFVVDSTAGESLSTTAERTGDCGVPPRLGSGSSLLSYSTFSFRVGADLNRTSTGRGRASLRQGYLVLGPKC